MNLLQERDFYKVAGFYLILPELHKRLFKKMPSSECQSMIF